MRTTAIAFGLNNVVIIHRKRTLGTIFETRLVLTRHELARIAKQFPVNALVESSGRELLREFNKDLKG